jgi:hypothetical protein
MKIFRKSYWEDCYYNTKRGIGNLFRYFRVVWGMVPWDSHSIYEMMKFQITILCNNIEKYGHEIDENRIPKIKDMRRCIEILDNIIEDKYMDLCGYDNNYKIIWKPTKKEDKKNFKLYEMTSDATKEQEKNNSRAIKESFELEEKELKELFDLMKKSGGWWD